MRKLFPSIFCIIFLCLTLNTEVNCEWPNERVMFAVREVYTTEFDYIKAMEDVIMGYLNPMLEFLKKDSEKHKIVSTIFRNIEDLYDFHLSFYWQLKEQESNPVGFGQVFIAYQYKFRLYCVFCTYQEESHAYLDKLNENADFRTFMSKCQANLGHDMAMNAYLLRPVQRIMKYPILFEAILKKYPKDFMGYETISNAYEIMKSVVSIVNEAQHHKQTLRKLESLKGSSTSSFAKSSSTKEILDTNRNGNLVLESECKVGPKWSSAHAMLFEKVLQVFKRKGSNKLADLVNEIWVGHMHVDHKYYTEKTNRLKVESTYESKTIELEFSSTKLQEKWYSDIINVIRTFKERRISTPTETFTYFNQKSPKQFSHIGKTPLGNIRSPSLGRRESSYRSITSLSPSLRTSRTESIASQSYGGSMSSFGERPDSIYFEDIPENEPRKKQ